MKWNQLNGKNIESDTQRQATIWTESVVSVCVSVFLLLSIRIFSFNSILKKHWLQTHTFITDMYVPYLALCVFVLCVSRSFRLAGYPKSKARHRKLPFLPVRVCISVSFSTCEQKPINWIGYIQFCHISFSSRWLFF